MLGSRVRGLVGARMELLDHQISIAHEVASRHHPKVLLADEVGLGKTIEAGMIFHRLFVTGQIGRVLVVAPSQLVHQWLVELYRRFNHMFTVVDEDLFRSEEKGDRHRQPLPQPPDHDLLGGFPVRLRQAREAGRRCRASICSSWTRPIISPGPKPPSRRSTPPSRPWPP